jgi:hypothetical protein
VVVLTAPRPTRSTPRRPRAGAIFTGVDTSGNYIIIDSWPSSAAGMIRTSSS